MSGKFIISLDFEIHWGVFDALSLDKYQSNLENVPLVVDRLMSLSDKYGVKLTFSTVGLLFAGSKDDIEKYMPTSIPKYSNPELDPFQLLDGVGNNEKTDSLHYAKSIINKIRENKNHEIGTHTFGHYNCLAKGQNIEDFSADIVASKKIANDLDIDIKSIVFPKNQVNREYLDVCSKEGIITYRGTEQHIVYDPDLPTKRKWFYIFYRLIRLADGYFNITGSNTYNIENIKQDESGMINLPSSRFLRPYIKRLSFLEGLKVRRINKAMRHAAKNNELFHLWWHPHNFGANMDENFNNLESIFKEYASLKKQYNFESITMTSQANKLIEDK